MEKRNIQSFLMVSAAFFALNVSACPIRPQTNAARTTSPSVSVSTARQDLIVKQ
jgi:hypothetical protein